MNVFLRLHANWTFGFIFISTITLFPQHSRIGYSLTWLLALLALTMQHACSQNPEQWLIKYFIRKRIGSLALDSFHLSPIYIRCSFTIFVTEADYVFKDTRFAVKLGSFTFIDGWLQKLFDSHPCGVPLSSICDSKSSTWNGNFISVASMLGHMVNTKQYHDSQKCRMCMWFIASEIVGRGF